MSPGLFVSAAENEIDGTALRSLLQDQAELKTALPIMGDRLRLKRAVSDDFCIVSALILLDALLRKNCVDVMESRDYG